MDVKLSVDDQEGAWMERRRKLEALTRDPPSQRHDNPAQTDKIMDPLLVSVAREGDVDKFIKALEDHCANERVPLPVLLERRSPSKNTLLHAAAESDDNVRALIHFFPEHLIYCENSRGETPLHIAASAGKAVAVELLLRQGVLMDPDRYGNYPLHEAVRNGHRNVIGQLVSQDPSQVYRQNKESKSPLCVAVETGDLEILTLLLDALDNGENQRRLFFGLLDMLEVMWEMKPWLYQLRDARYGTPLHLAACRNYLYEVKFLIEKFPISALEEDFMGYLPIHVACMMGRVEIVEELLQQWPDPAEFSTEQGQNILHVSARYGGIATVRYILKDRKFNHLINAKDFHGNTPLHLAALHCQPSVVLLARDTRVDLKLVNKDYMTALDAVEQNIEEVNPPLWKRLTWITVTSAGIWRSQELAVRRPTGWSPGKRFALMGLEIYRDRADSCAVVLALMASVTFTSGFSIPGGYNGSEEDAGIPILLHKAMYNVFVVCNSIAMYSSIMALVILLWFHIDPYVGRIAIFLSNLPMFVTLITMPLAFLAGVYVTVSKLAWLSIFVLVLGSVALFIILSLLILCWFPFVSRHPLIRSFSDLVLFWGLVIARREAAGSETREVQLNPTGNSL